ncbi:MAG: class IV adenylate cyclase [Treponema sp.]|nr:class IV adenylate cyclase [Treponema sp.]
MIEIELKAWVSDPEETKAVVSALASLKREFDKEDVYWYPAAPRSAVPNFGVRIRREDRSARALVTYKIKERRGGVEVNDEREFEASDREPFEALLGLLGFRIGARKRKKGWAWTMGDITVELCEVYGVGWFVELEILAPSSDEQTVREARSRLLSFLREIGVSEDKIESRYYTEMLKE